MNQALTQEKTNAYTRKIKTAQFIYIIEKVGLMNQAPTRILIIKVCLRSYVSLA